MATTTQGVKRLPLGSIVWREPSRPIDAKHVKELAASIEEVGLLQPIGVVDLGEEKYEGRLGRHRYEAVKSLGQETIDACVLDLDEVGREIATVHENLKRRDLSPIERAQAFRRYADYRKAQDPKLTQEAVAKELQVSPSEFSNTVMLLDQDPHVQKLVDDGRISPGHVEHVLAPLAKELEKDEVVKFAHAIAGVPEKGKPALDIRTAKADGDRLLEKHRTEVLHEAAMAEAKKAKAKVLACPFCNYGDRAPEKFYLSEGRPVLEHKLPWGEGSHRWYGDTGEIYYTPAEKKELERRKAEDAKEREKARKAAKAKGALTKEGKVPRDYAVFLSRASLEEWGRGLLAASEKAGLFEVRLGEAQGPVWRAPEGGLHVEARGKLPVPDPLLVSAASLEGAKEYRSRVQFGTYASLESRRDNVAERTDVKALAADRAKLLAFQRTFGPAQKDEDRGPAELGGFRIGERVKLGAGCAPAGYAGREATILAFDVADDAKGAPTVAAAVLDVSWPSKVHAVSVLVTAARFACAKCGRTAVVATRDGKKVRVCNGPCGLEEGKCTCPSKASKKGKAPKARAT